MPKRQKMSCERLCVDDCGLKINLSKGVAGGNHDFGLPQRQG